MKNQSKLLNTLTSKQLQHIYAIWLYTYGGTSDVRTLEEFIQYDYQDNPDLYGNCPCHICQTIS